MADETIPASQQRPVTRYIKGEPARVREAVAEEAPVAIVYNGVSHAVMLATPADLEDFAVGFSLSEGIVDSYAGIGDVEVTACRDGITVDVTIGNGPFERLKERRRTLAGRTGCGLCGTESLDQVLRPLRRIDSDFALRPDTLAQLSAALAQGQALHGVTGAVHAAGFGLADGTVPVVREDVGRHNALDKLIGALARQRADFGHGIAMLTSRASSEMVQKAATVGIPMLAAISAPTNLAVRIAEDAGVTLVAWLRQDRFSVYTHGERIAAPALENVR